MPLGAARLILFSATTAVTATTLAVTTATLSISAPDPFLAGEALISPSVAELVVTAPDPGVGITAIEVSTAELIASAVDPIVEETVAGYSNGYAYRIRLVVPATSVLGGSNVADMPMLFWETLPNLRTAANGGRLSSASGFDLRFEDSAGTKLSHDLPVYGAATGEVLTWVRIPLLSRTADNVLFLYYGKAGLSTTEADAALTWRDYLTVWDARTGTDRSGNGRDLTMTGVATGTLVGDAGSYDGATAYGQRTEAGGISWLTSATALSVQAIVRSSVTGQRKGIIALGPSSATDAESGLFLAYVNASWASATSAIQFQRRTSAGSSYIVSTSNRQSTSDQYLTATWAEGAAPTLYIDGAAIAPAASASNAGSALTASQTDLWMALAPGSLTPASTGWNGLLDEVRIAAAALPAARIATEHANLSDRQLFYGYGAEDAFGTATPSVVAVPMRVSTTENVAATIDVVAAATKPAGSGSIAISVAQPAHGVTSVVSGKIRYVPTTNYEGSDSFSYSLTADGKTTTSKASIVVGAAPPPSTSWYGPNSGLDWHSGFYHYWNTGGAIQNGTTALEWCRKNLTTGLIRGPDAVLTFLARGPFSIQGQGWLNVWNNDTRWHPHIVDEDIPVVVLTCGPLCSTPANGGDSNNTLSTWPANKSGITTAHWISMARPVGFQASGLSYAQKRERSAEVAFRAGDGWFDHIWEPALVTFKNATANRLNGRTVVMRHFWECDKLPGIPLGSPAGSKAMEFAWGSTDPMISHNPMNCMRTQADSDAFRSMIKRYSDIFKSVFPTGQVHWSPLRNVYNTSAVWPAGEPVFGNMLSFIRPTDWDHVGPDWYNRDDVNGNTRGTTQNDPLWETRWDQVFNVGSFNNPKGLRWWAEWVRYGRTTHPFANPNLRLSVAEWAGTWELHPDQSPQLNPHDDPIHDRKMYEFFAANADIIGYECRYVGKSNQGTKFTEYTYIGPTSAGQLAFPWGTEAYSGAYRPPNNWTGP